MVVADKVNELGRIIISAFERDLMMYSHSFFLVGTIPPRLYLFQKTKLQ